MSSEHIHMLTVKQYLLGTLSDTEASAIEERYVTNPLFFNEVRAAEIDLIITYLDGKLLPEEHAQFEERYLTIPALQALVERVRAQRVMAVPAVTRQWQRQLILASSIVVTVIAAFVIHGWRRPTQQAEVHLPPATIRLVLEPGVTMGASSQTKLLKLPTPAAPIALVAELPGETSSADYIASLRNVDAERTQAALLTSSPLRSMPGHGRQEVVITFDSSILPAGDYILELKTQEGKLRETYLFRATASSQ